MRLPLQITFRHLAPSRTMEAAIHEGVDKLEHFYRHIIGCRIAVEATHHQNRELYRVRIDLTVPGAELVVGEEVSEHNTREDAYLAIREAFHEMRRRLQQYVRRRRGDVKQHANGMSR
jgi:ribosomal subunit interface protein